MTGNLVRSARRALSASLSASPSGGTDQRYARRNHSRRECLGRNGCGHHGRHGSPRKHLARSRSRCSRIGPFFRDLSFSGAARITNVEGRSRPARSHRKNKGNWTYKLGGNWAVTNWLRFRGTYGTSFRAPALVRRVQGRRNELSERAHDRSVRQLGVQPGAGEYRPADLPTTAPQRHSGQLWRRFSITATVHSSGRHRASSIPETSTALTASIILTPRFPSAEDAHEPCGRLFRHQGEGRGFAARRTEHCLRML